MNYKQQLERAIELKRRCCHEKASYLLDELASAFLYNHNYNKQDLDVALFCIKAIKRRRGANVATFAAMKVRDDREQKITCSLSELDHDFADTRQTEKNESISLTKTISFVKENKKLLLALQKNCSSQYINRLLFNSRFKGKGALLKRLYDLNKSLFY